MSSVSSSQSLACGTAPVNASLQEEARSLVRHRMCTSASGARIDLQLLPEVKGNAHHTYAWARSRAFLVWVQELLPVQNFKKHNSPHERGLWDLTLPFRRMEGPDPPTVL